MATKQGYASWTSEGVDEVIEHYTRALKYSETAKKAETQKWPVTYAKESWSADNLKIIAERNIKEAKRLRVIYIKKLKVQLYKGEALLAELNKIQNQAIDE